MSKSLYANVIFNRADGVHKTTRECRNIFEDENENENKFFAQEKKNDMNKERERKEET